MMRTTDINRVQRRCAHRRGQPPRMPPGPSPPCGSGPAPRGSDNDNLVDVDSLHSLEPLARLDGHGITALGVH
ncbi:hypothetical protein HYQ46_001363 [Verticillium longisporum]|nr:hypothetical protein HYQ46_001363 [Verticillium longisporum]